MWRWSHLNYFFRWLKPPISNFIIDDIYIYRYPQHVTRTWIESHTKSGFHVGGSTTKRRAWFVKWLNWAISMEIKSWGVMILPILKWIQMVIWLSIYITLKLRICWPAEDRFFFFRLPWIRNVNCSWIVIPGRSWLVNHHQTWLQLRHGGSGCWRTSNGTAVSWLVHE